MRLAIMQPYFLPYIGYFQLIGAVDLFVIYDNIKYTKKGWINRNRFLRHGSDHVFSVPLRSDSDSLDVRDRRLAASFDRPKLVNQLRDAYRRAPCFASAFPRIEEIVRCPEENLFDYVFNSVAGTCDYLGLYTRMVRSSGLDIEPSLRAQDKVLAICGAVGATSYVNPIGGTELYAENDFLERGIELRFLRALPVEYAQFDHPFVPWLSIVDVMMFNPTDVIRGFLDSHYELVRGHPTLPNRSLE